MIADLMHSDLGVLLAIAAVAWTVLALVIKRGVRRG